MCYLRRYHQGYKRNICQLTGTRRSYHADRIPRHQNDSPFLNNRFLLQCPSFVDRVEYFFTIDANNKFFSCLNSWASDHRTEFSPLKTILKAWYTVDSALNGRKGAAAFIATGRWKLSRFQLKIYIETWKWHFHSLRRMNSSPMWLCRCWSYRDNSQGYTQQPSVLLTLRIRISFPSTSKLWYSVPACLQIS